MGEISGLGGGYEEACQDMLEAGVIWLDENIDVWMTDKLEVKTYENIYGVLEPQSPGAKALSKHITNAVDDCTGAMHQAVMSRLLAIAKYGWDGYVDRLRENRREKTE